MEKRVASPFFLSSIGWGYALWIWAYALVWFLVNDVVKMGAYRMLRTEWVA